MNKVILITGCSTGIGRELAQRLSQSGHTVIATARSVEAMDLLNVALKLPLDVTNPESIQSAVNATLEHFGRIDILVNNAGYAQVGAIEELSDTQIQKMYDVNVFGVIRMIRAIVPHMRKHKTGLIINMSSVAGKLVTPVNGIYSSSKFALEAISDALRFELKPFNINVVLIEPGAIKTNFDMTVHVHGDAILSNPLSPYLSLYQKHAQVSDGMRGNQPEPVVVYKEVEKAISSLKPKSRYLAGFAFPGSAVIAMRDHLWDLVVKQMFKTAPQE
ncbi:SDR family oxidoreductase [bacterium]|nr:SDR family oxidoreductase [bacterium]